MGSFAINEQALVKVRSLCLPRHPPIVFVNIAALVKVEESTAAVVLVTAVVVLLAVRSTVCP